MKLKKKVKLLLIAIIVILVIAITSILIIVNLPKKAEKDEPIKVINEVEKYGYQLKENKSKRYKTLFEELKEILQEETIDEQKYVSKLAEMFIYDFYSLDNKAAKTDVGGVDFVYKGALENFLINAQDTFYKYVESNIYNNRNQELPEVDAITIEEISNKQFAYEGKTDDNAFVVKASWFYTKDQFASYQKSAQLVFIHDENKLSLVELK